MSSIVLPTCLYSTRSSAAEQRKADAVVIFCSDGICESRPGMDYKRDSRGESSDLIKLTSHSYQST